MQTNVITPSLILISPPLRGVYYSYTVDCSYSLFTFLPRHLVTTHTHNGKLKILAEVDDLGMTFS
jgi:hypothetical protein